MARAKRYDSKRRVLRDGEYEHKDKGFYEFRWREVKGFSEKGTKLYKQRSISAKTLDELRELELKLQKDKMDGIKHKQPQTLNDYVDKWLSLKKGLKDNTRSNYQYMYNRFVRRTKIGTCKVQELKKSDLVEFYNKLVEKGTLSISTCETLQNVIGPALQMCFEEDDLIRRNPSSNALRELKKEARLKEAEARALGIRAKTETLTLAEQIRFLDVIKDTIWEPVFVIDLCTGLRVGELTCLRWSSIDEAAGVIHVKQNLVYFQDLDKKCKLSIHATKTNAGERDIPLNDTIRKMLDRQRSFGLKCTHPVESEAGPIDDFIFVNREGFPHGQDTLNRALRRIVENANDAADVEHGQIQIPKFSSHKIRKTMACNAIRRGLGIEEIATLLGHTDIQTTHQFYLLAKDLIAADKDEKLVEELKRRGIL